MRLIVKFFYEMDYCNYGTCIEPVTYESAEALYVFIENKAQQYIDWRNSDNFGNSDYNRDIIVGNTIFDAIYFTSYDEDAGKLILKMPEILTLDEFYFEVENT